MSQSGILASYRPEPGYGTGAPYEVAQIIAIDTRERFRACPLARFLPMLLGGFERFGHGLGDGAA